MGWSSAQYTDALRHVESSPRYDPNFRHLLHVGFKVAAGMGKRFIAALEAKEEIVGRNVTDKLFYRHLQPIFAACPGIGCGAAGFGLGRRAPFY
jgi:tagaturonate epimerase